VGMSSEKICTYGLRYHRKNADWQEALDSERRAMVSFSDPCAQRWEEHFARIEADTIIRGKAPQGRATVMVLRMNHSDIVATRHLWVISSWHPPVD
jgi:hypothetical protein